MVYDAEKEGRKEYSVKEKLGLLIVRIQCRFRGGSSNASSTDIFLFCVSGGEFSSLGFDGSTTSISAFLTGFVLVDLRGFLFGINCGPSETTEHVTEVFPMSASVIGINCGSSETTDM
jgi:hypothetical protein